MSNFVDLHHHLIYGVDDGAKSLENMQEMILQAAEEGIADIVCTSHATPGYEPFPREIYDAHLAEARAFIREQEMDMRVHPGCEVLYTDAAARLLREGKYPTLADSNAVLVEFTPDTSFRQLKEAASSFGMAGLQVLFAHVERYEALRNLKNVRVLREEYGVFMQMNANTIITRKGFFTERWVRHMLKEGYIDCIATDAHNLTYRKCQMRRAYEMLRERCSQEYADDLCGGFQRRLLEI